MTQRPTYVIAGGSGLIGQALSRHWLGVGARVVVLTRHRDAKLPAGAEAVQWDGVNAGPWHQCIDGARALINLCGEGIGAQRWTDARKRLLLDSRTVPTAALVAAIRAAAVRPALIQASGVGIYGTSDASVFTESSPAGHDFLARLAQLWEDASAPADAYTRRVVARIGVVLDREAGAFPKLLLPFRLGVGGPIADGRQWLSWIHLTDLVEAIAWLADNGSMSGAINCVAPQSVRNADAARVIGRIAHRPAFVPTPRFALNLLLGEMATLVCDGQRVAPVRLLESGFRFRYTTFEAAASALLKSTLEENS